jgi:catechol 2,3-dioxygenase-like lactoylglutathione lyase family enzyme
MPQEQANVSAPGPVQNTTQTPQPSADRSHCVRGGAGPLRRWSVAIPHDPRRSRKAQNAAALHSPVLTAAVVPATSLMLNHYSIRTQDVARCRDFYAHVLGLTEGPRPAFSFSGAWMYRSDHADYANAVVHIIGKEPQPADRLQGHTNEQERAHRPATGSLDHIAFFAADGLSEMLARLNSRGVPYREQTVPGIGFHQLFLQDPEGITVEVSYPASEKIRHDQAVA